jgi:6-phosphogluconolactonase
MSCELIVPEDVAWKAADLFHEIAPRTVALAGGGTPRAMYERLATTHYDWTSVEVFFSDERCVPPDDEASNYRMANAALLSKVEARVHRMKGEACDADGYEQEMREVFGPGGPRFDLLLLGLGEDGHTASLFPGDPALEVRDRWVVTVERADYRRLTLTLPVLSAAKVAMFLVTGQQKRAAMRQLLSEEDVPAARVEAERVIVLADKAALPLGLKPSP